jgi:polysaccharide biosynthesis protein PslH
VKILWVKSDFLHPTTKGGQIRTLEMLRRLRSRHEIHYVAFAGADPAEALRRSSEYCDRSYPIAHTVPSHRSLRFAWQLVQGLASKLPVAVSRYRSTAMRQKLESLLESEHFDAVVCDFPIPAINFSRGREYILFEHNVETMIWRRHVEAAKSRLLRAYFRAQARKMLAYEQAVCSAAKHVIAVSPVDAQLIQQWFGLREVSFVDTGVDIEHFAPKPSPRRADLIFVGSMDWLPNIDGIKYFVHSVLPLIRKIRPDCSLAIVGRDPAPEILALASADQRIEVTGTVPDVRPYLWGSAVSIVPLRIGGGTRLKIYESMAAQTAVVSTTTGAEGLVIDPPHTIRIADSPQDFAAQCLELLSNELVRKQQVDAAWQVVATRFSWDVIARQFEQIVERHAGDVPHLVSTGA